MMLLKNAMIAVALVAGLLALAACGAKGPEAELKAAKEAVSAAKTAQVDAANADLKAAEEALAKAEKEISEQNGAAIKDFTVAKDLLAKAKALGEKALADQKAEAGSNTAKADPPKIKS
jgi:predicted small lipoprotein YifL